VSPNQLGDPVPGWDRFRVEFPLAFDFLRLPSVGGQIEAALAVDCQLDPLCHNPVL